MVRSESAGPSFRQRGVPRTQCCAVVFRAVPRHRLCIPQRGGGCAVCGASVECGVRGVGGGTEIAALDVLSTSRTRRVWMVRAAKECGAVYGGACTFRARTGREADGC